MVLDEAPPKSLANEKVLTGEVTSLSQPHFPHAFGGHSINTSLFGAKVFFHPHCGQRYRVGVGRMGMALLSRLDWSELAFLVPIFYESLKLQYDRLCRFVD